MSKFDIYVKVSILINYKTKQQSNLAWNISLTSWLCGIGIPFSVRPSVSTFISKYDIYVKISIIINYNSTTTIIPCMTHLPDLLTWQVHWPSDLDLYLCSSDFDTIYVDVPDLLKYKVYNYQTLHSASPRCTESAVTLTSVTLTYILRSSDFDTFCVDVWYLLNYKASNHQTLQSASSQCTDSADILTWWPWPIFWLQWLWHNLCNIPDLLKCKTSSHQTLHSASPRCTDSAGILTWWRRPIFCAQNIGQGHRVKRSGRGFMQGLMVV